MAAPHPNNRIERRFGLQGKFILLVVVLLAMAAANIATFHLMLGRLDGVAQTVDQVGQLRMLSQKAAFEAYADLASRQATIQAFDDALRALDAGQPAGITLRRIAPGALPLLAEARRKWAVLQQDLSALAARGPGAPAPAEHAAQLLQDAESMVDALTLGSQRIHRQATLTLYLLFAIEFVVLLVLLHTTRQQFVSPLRELARHHLNLSRGRFGSYAGLRPNDEIGELADAFNFASREIRALLEKKEHDRAALAQSVAMFKGLAENSLMGVYILHEDLSFYFANRTLAQMFQLDEARFAELGILDLVDPLDHQAIRQNTRMRLAGKSDRAVYEVAARRRDGSPIDIEIFASVMHLHGERALIGTIVDITERKQHQRQRQREYLEQLQYQASHDELTGLANRKHFLDRLGQATSLARRSNALVGVLLMDLDDFKVINDSLGHCAGDDLLRAVALRLRNALRESDTVARLGGDEFAILLPSIGDAEEAASVAAKLLQVLSHSFVIQTREIHVGASIGISLFPLDGSEDYLLKNADLAMYHAKRQDGRRMHFYSEELDIQNQRHMTLEAELRLAVERNELSLVYQPKVSLATRRIEGAEALLRWHHPRLGTISPAEFIPIAESTGLIIPIGEWVLRTACLQSRAWQDAGLAPFPLAINLSARQFLGEGLVPLVRRVLQETGLQPRCLELELTETVLIRNMGETGSALRELKRMGVGLSLDDFGTCYSSLSYLLQLPFDILKLDLSFVRNLSVIPNARTLTRAIIDLSHSLGLKVVAEGIETDEQLGFLREHGCDIGQGYLFSRPLEAAALLDYLRANAIEPGIGGPAADPLQARAGWRSGPGNPAPPYTPAVLARAKPARLAPPVTSTPRPAAEPRAARPAPAAG
ncbi:EAL domain-containing protein [Pseudomonas oligotrophica]|uniref:EAL domain-containing protein n=1 Tax=Pseudomonas oligotrophica TaxID=2912055 RepID=UPI001F21E28B|nr:EAL domain-containing protein [Pseudomonas oligotrophica]MCF7200923.1 EAL domain-containing protein [Pseudomonas oligotrophica]